MITFSIHTQARIQERELLPAWIESTIITPDWTAPDRNPALTRSFKAIGAFGGRILKVVHRWEW